MERTRVLLRRFRLATHSIVTDRADAGYDRRREVLIGRGLDGAVVLGFLGPSPGLVETNDALPGTLGTLVLLTPSGFDHGIAFPHLKGCN